MTFFAIVNSCRGTESTLIARNEWVENGAKTEWQIVNGRLETSFDDAGNEWRVIESSFPFCISLTLCLNEDDCAPPRLYFNSCMQGFCTRYVIIAELFSISIGVVFTVAIADNLAFTVAFTVALTFAIRKHDDLADTNCVVDAYIKRVSGCVSLAVSFAVGVAESVALSGAHPDAVPVDNGEPITEPVFESGDIKITVCIANANVYPILNTVNVVRLGDSF